ncbi:replication protein A 70 kDa DNA-binding subunit A-like [Arachis hypogaea]|uniref:replication protein A 70 kDa DNA-binding subunit A-like n=1 Tax=Arachis hypogaea TaxID=3818 RepID=UPI003B22282D
MEEKYDSISEVNLKRLWWNFKVYIVRIWEELSKYNKQETWSIEMVLQDNKGDRIYSTVPRALVQKWTPILHEFQMYTMTNFTVVDNKTKTKNGVSRYVLTFSHRTKVTHVEVPTFPLQAFRFRSFVDLQNAAMLGDADMFDIIGEVVGKEEPRDLITSKGRETKRLVVILQDLDNNRMSCTLFGDLVDQIVPHLQEERVEPLIVVMQYFKVSRWNGKTSVQSNFAISKVHINLDLEEVNFFKTRVVSAGPSSVSRISYVSSPRDWSAADELKNGCVAVKTIEEALNVAQEGPIWIAGTIVSINAGKAGWFYKACRRCLKKVETPVGTRYECAKCGHTHGVAALRYKVEVMAHDETDSICLLLWDKETTQLCGKPAESIFNEKLAPDDEYPHTLDNMMDKKVLFKLNVKAANVKQYDPVYTVMKVCDDEDTISKNLPMTLVDNNTHVVNEAGNNNSFDIPGIVVNLTIDNDTHFNMDFTQECVSSIKFKTPAKRVASGVKVATINLNQDEEEVHHSTNRFTRKLSKKMKSQQSDIDS